MSGPAATPLKIKEHGGWFAAGAGWQAALEKLSDGAFKLFVYLSLGAERSSGCFVFRQRDLARALRRSRRSIGTYLGELEEEQVCRIRRSPNQHAPGLLEIADDYWPYERTDPLQSAKSAQTLYVEAIGQMLLERPAVRCSYSGSDRRLAAGWFHQGIELDDVQQAILLGCGRKYISWLNGAPPGQPIGSLHYFSSVLEEVAASHLSAQYRAFNRMQVLRLEQRWLDTEENRNRKGEACLGKVFPGRTAENQEKRDDVDPLTGGITLVKGWGNNLGD